MHLIGVSSESSTDGALEQMAPSQDGKVGALPWMKIAMHSTQLVARCMFPCYPCKNQYHCHQVSLPA